MNMNRMTIVMATMTLFTSSSALAQERTSQSAVQFLNQFFTQERPESTLSDGLNVIENDYEYSLSSGTERILSARAVGDPPGDATCITKLGFDDRSNEDVDWRVATATLTTFDPPRFSAMPAGRALVEITYDRSGGPTRVIWAGSDVQAQRLFAALEFLRNHCDGLAQTGF